MWLEQGEQEGLWEDGRSEIRGVQIVPYEAGLARCLDNGKHVRALSNSGASEA